MSNEKYLFEERLFAVMAKANIEESVIKEFLSELRTIRLHKSQIAIDAENIEMYIAYLDDAQHEHWFYLTALVIKELKEKLEQHESNLHK